MADPLTYERLLDLYRLALDEYRFEVRLGWDRTTYFLILNSGILTVATGLLKIDNAPAVYLINALLFCVGCGTAYVGSKSIRKNHEYYRRTIVKKTLIENQMGLADAITGMNPSLNLSIGTTAGQGGHLRILDNPEAYIAQKLHRSSVTYWLWCILIALVVFDVVGLVISILMMIFAVRGHGTAAAFIVSVTG
jgi:hypothetical protein